MARPSTRPSTRTSTYNNVEGPRTGEFLNDRRGLGTQGIHNDNTLGSVVTYPGVDEVASTATDPLDGIYRSGLHVVRPAQWCGHPRIRRGAWHQ